MFEFIGLIFVVIRCNDWRLATPRQYYIENQSGYGGRTLMLHINTNVIPSVLAVNTIVCLILFRAEAVCLYICIIDIVQAQNKDS